jgi:hypothetical protein
MSIQHTLAAASVPAENELLGLRICRSVLRLYLFVHSEALLQESADKVGPRI